MRTMLKHWAAAPVPSTASAAASATPTTPTRPTDDVCRDERRLVFVCQAHGTGSLVRCISSCSCVMRGVTVPAVAPRSASWRAYNAAHGREAVAAARGAAVSAQARRYCEVVRKVPSEARDARCPPARPSQLTAYR